MRNFCASLSAYLIIMMILKWETFMGKLVAASSDNKKNHWRIKEATMKIICDQWLIINFGLLWAAVAFLSCCSILFLFISFQLSRWIMHEVIAFLLSIFLFLSLFSSTHVLIECYAHEISLFFFFSYRPLVRQRLKV